MAKQLFFHGDALDRIKVGVDKMAAAVGVTMGPNGQNVIIARNNAMAITKDGVSVARELDLEDYVENVGAQLIKQIAQKTAFEAGDGTTTSTILAAAIFNEGYPYYKRGINPIEMKRGMEKQVKHIVSLLNETALKIKDGDVATVKNIAAISANNDFEIGSLISDAFGAIGFKGVIVVQESKTSETFIDIVDGLQFDQGFVSPFFSTGEKQIVEFKNPLIFIYDGKINTFNDIFKFLEYASLNKRPVVFISDGIDAEALNAILVNCMRGQLQACVIKAPAYGEHRFNMLVDIATVLGGRVISEKDGVHISDVTKDSIEYYAGTCERIKVDSKTTSIIGGAGDAAAISDRATEIQEAIEEAQTASEKLILHERAAKLSNGVAILKVGANSDLELREKLDRIDDALSATRAAIEEGYIQGGGIALHDLADSKVLTLENADQEIGAEIVRRACRAPFETIVSNSGQNPDVIRMRLKQGAVDAGYNAKTDTVENLFEAGVIDPVKVTRCSLENALSVASLILTTGCLMVQPPAPLAPPIPNSINV